MSAEMRFQFGNIDRFHKAIVSDDHVRHLLFFCIQWVASLLLS